MRARRRTGARERPAQAKGAGNTPLPKCCPRLVAHGQAQLEPTAESVLAMLLPALCTFCPWALACS